MDFGGGNRCRACWKMKVILETLRRLFRQLWLGSAFACPERWVGGGWEPGACEKCPLKGKCE